MKKHVASILFWLVSLSLFGQATSPTPFYYTPKSPATYLKHWWSAQTVEDATGNFPDPYEGVFKIKDRALTSPIDLPFVGVTTGFVQHQGTNFDAYGATDPYPRYVATDGGFVQITNSVNQRFETTAGLNEPGAFVIMYYVQLTGGTDNEYWFDGSNSGGARDRDLGTGNSTQLGQFNSLVTMSPAARLLPIIVYQKVLLSLVRDALGNMTIYVNGVQFGTSVAVGTNNMTEHFWGSNAHNANISMFETGYYTGARDVTKEQEFLAYNEFYHGKGYGRSNTPMVTFDTSGYNDELVWNSTGKYIQIPSYQFRSPSGAAEGASQCRLYTTGQNVIANAVENRTYVKTKVKGVDANWDKFYRGIDWGVAPGTTTGFYLFIEYLGVDANGVMQVVETQSQPFLDNQP